jgi:nitrous oxidase accessory protein NosD
MRRLAVPYAIGAAAIGLFVVAAPAQAALRTFVSGTGTNAGTCTRAAPCATFAFAHGVTDDGGTINCVDADNFGNVVITKSITIDCAGTLGGINSGATDGITVNAPSIIVRIRNLSLNGMGVGLNGILFLNGAALFVENCAIANYNGGAVGNGIGIKFAPPNGITAGLYVTDSTITGNGRTSDGGGIVIQPTGTGAARVTIERTLVENNTYGIFANGTGSTGTIAVQIRDSVAAESKFHGISAFTTVTASITSITVARSSSLLNAGNGVLAQSPRAFVLLGDATVMSNGTGLSAVSGGNILSYQDNQLTGNVSDGAPTATLTVK